MTSPKVHHCVVGDRQETVLRPVARYLIYRARMRLQLRDDVHGLRIYYFHEAVCHSGNEEPAAGAGVGADWQELQGIDTHWLAGISLMCLEGLNKE